MTVVRALGDTVACRRVGRMPTHVSVQPDTSARRRNMFSVGIRSRSRMLSVLYVGCRVRSG